MEDRSVGHCGLGRHGDRLVHHGHRAVHHHVLHRVHRCVPHRLVHGDECAAALAEPVVALASGQVHPKRMERHRGACQ